MEIAQRMINIKINDFVLIMNENKIIEKIILLPIPFNSTIQPRSEN